ncbi:MAG: hypothetical protein JW855_05155 [Gammaproteobacteria bacterium]|nr:hypothetical protein [Gammaproteobacteria bacterium]
MAFDLTKKKEEKTKSKIRELKNIYVDLDRASEKESVKKLMENLGTKKLPFEKNDLWFGDMHGNVKRLLWLLFSIEGFIPADINPELFGEDLKIVWEILDKPWDKLTIEDLAMVSEFFKNSINRDFNSEINFLGDVLGDRGWNYKKRAEDRESSGGIERFKVGNDIFSFLLLESLSQSGKLGSFIMGNHESAILFLLWTMKNLEKKEFNELWSKGGLSSGIGEIDSAQFLTGINFAKLFLELGCLYEEKEAWGNRIFKFLKEHGRFSDQRMYFDDETGSLRLTHGQHTPFSSGERLRSPLKSTMFDSRMLSKSIRGVFQRDKNFEAFLEEMSRWPLEKFHSNFTPRVEDSWGGCFSLRKKPKEKKDNISPLAYFLWFGTPNIKECKDVTFSQPFFGSTAEICFKCMFKDTFWLSAHVGESYFRITEDKTDSTRAIRIGLDVPIGKLGGVQEVGKIPSFVIDGAKRVKEERLNQFIEFFDRLNRYLSTFKEEIGKATYGTSGEYKELLDKTLQTIRERASKTLVEIFPELDVKRIITNLLRALKEHLLNMIEERVRKEKKSSEKKEILGWISREQHEERKQRNPSFWAKKGTEKREIKTIVTAERASEFWKKALAAQEGTEESEIKRIVTEEKASKASEFLEEAPVEFLEEAPVAEAEDEGEMEETEETIETETEEEFDTTKRLLFH